MMDKMQMLISRDSTEETHRLVMVSSRIGIEFRHFVSEINCFRDHREEHDDQEQHQQYCECHSIVAGW